LPDPPPGFDQDAGALTDSTAVYNGHRGVVFDTTTDSWLVVPDLPDGDLDGRTVVAAGAEMLVFGGMDLGSSPATGSDDGQVFVNSTWIWPAGR
jgi:hypothetical protein